MSFASKVILAGAAAWIVTSPETIKNLPVIGETRRISESIFTVIYKTARGTGRAAWYSATTMLFMVYPVLYVLAPEDAGAEVAATTATAT